MGGPWTPALMLYASDTLHCPEQTPPPADSSAGCTASLAAARIDARSGSDPGWGNPPAQTERSTAGISACSLPLRRCRVRWRRERKYIEEFKLTKRTCCVWVVHVAIAFY